MKTLLPMIVLSLAMSSLSAQEKLTRYFPAGEANAEILINNFLTPLGEDISVLPNNGWYTTAKTHEKWGFDLSVTVNSVFTSNEKKSYSFPSLSGLDFLGIDGTNGGIGAPVPTAYGVEGDHPHFEITSGSDSGAEFRGPDGFEPGSEYIFEAQAIYTIQGGLGLFKNTDLRFRFTPKTTISSVEFGNWGIGVMHDLTQHFWGTEKLFSLSVFLGYTAINGTVDLSESDYSGSGQEAVVTTTGFTGQIVASKDLSVFTFYGALGYDTGKTDIDINGDYDVDTYIDATSGGTFLLTQPFTLNDPYSYSYDNSGLRFTLGLRVKLGPVTLNGDYSFVGDNRVLALGLGFTVK